VFLIEAEDQLVKRSAGWVETHDTKLHGDRGVRTETVGSMLYFSFSGTALVVMHNVGPDGGKFLVRIGEGTQTIHGWSVKTGAKEKAYRVPSVNMNVPFAKHAATITCLRGVCELDFLLVENCQ
jgi:hypothetical protein